MFLPCESILWVKRGFAEPIFQNLPAVVAGDDLANQLRRGHRLIAENQSARQKLLRLGESRLLVGKERAEPLPCRDRFAQLHEHLDAGVRGHRLSSTLAARAQALHRPADFFAIAAAEKAAARSQKILSEFWSVELRRVFEYAGVSALHLHHAQEDLVRAAVYQLLFREVASRLRAL